MKHWMMVFMAATALTFTGCNKQESETKEPAAESAPETAPAESTEAAAPEASEATPAAEAPAPAAAEATPAETEASAATPAPEAAATPAPEAAAAPATTTFVDEVVGTGEEATPGRIVIVHYTGTLTDGTQFDSSRGKAPFEFNLGTGQVIAGWDKGVAGMKVGGKRKLTIPASEGYGSAGAGGVIKPGDTLLFDVELLGLK